MITVSKRINKPRVSFNPRGFRQARKRLDEGDPRPLITMMKEAAVDSHVTGCLTGRTAGYKRPFTLTAYDDQAGSAERRDWFSGVLQRLHLRELLEAVHAGRLYVYNVIDFTWEVVEGRQVPTSFEEFDQKHFRYDEQTGELGIDFGRELRPLPPEALISENRKMPVMLPVLRDFILKKFGLEAWSSFLENFGEAFIFGKYPPGADEKFKQQLEDGVNALASSSRGIAPDGSTIEVIESARTTGDHQDYDRRCNAGIAIALLGHANAVQDSDGMQVGQNLTAYEVRFEIAVDDCHFIEPYVNRLISVIGDRNFADGRYPRFELSKVRPVDVRQHAEIIDMAFRHGVPIDPDEYRKLGIYVEEGNGPFQREAGPRLFD